MRPGPRLFVAAIGAALFLAPALAAAQEAMQRAPRFDWVADRRAFVTGDIITVLIDEYTLASADKSSIASRDRSRQASLGAGYGVDGAGMGGEGSYRSGMKGETRDRGQTRRTDRLNTEITARVVAIEPNGVLRIEGRKRMMIDNHEQEITLTGLVRPEDVGTDNVVDSWRIADAVIAYESNGKLDQPRGLLGRILDVFWP